MHPNLRAGACALATCALLVPVLAGADDDESAHAGHAGHGGHAAHVGHRPYSHAPIGVMGEHMHEKGGWMLSYRYMQMRMNKNRDDTTNLSPSEVLAQGYVISPTDMDMWMSMIGVMVAPADWVTLTAMLPIVQFGMDHVNRAGASFRTKSSGVGDLGFGGLFRLFDVEVGSAEHHAHLNAGLTAPIGKLNNRDVIPTPMGPMEVRLPYPMQMGSGTWDFQVGATYTGEMPSWSWGFQSIGTLRTGKNKYDYRKGDGVLATAWVAKPWLSWLSTSFRSEWSWWGNYSGADPALNPFAVPTADPKRRGGNRLDLLPGISLLLPLGFLGENRLAIEGSFPVYQSLDGPQLKKEWGVTVGWQKAF